MTQKIIIMNKLTEVHIEFSKIHNLIIFFIQRHHSTNILKIKTKTMVFNI